MGVGVLDASVIESGSNLLSPQQLIISDGGAKDCPHAGFFRLRFTPATPAVVFRQHSYSTVYTQHGEPKLLIQYRQVLGL